MEQFNPAYGGPANDGQETAATHGGLQVPGCHGSKRLGAATDVAKRRFASSGVYILLAILEFPNLPLGYVLRAHMPSISFKKKVRVAFRISEVAPPPIPAMCLRVFFQATSFLAASKKSCPSQVRCAGT